MSSGTALHGTTYTTPTSVLHNPRRRKSAREHLEQPKASKAPPGKKGKNVKTATDSLFLEHGHCLHQHTGLKSVIEQSYCVMTQVLLVGTRTERKSLSKIAFTERSNGTVKQTGGLQMGTSIFCLACKISSGTVKGRRGVWVCTDTQSFS